MQCIISKIKMIYISYKNGTATPKGVAELVARLHQLVETDLTLFT